MYAERRSARRLKVTRGRIWIDQPRAHWAEILDVSAGGARIATPHLLELGAHLHLQPATPGDARKSRSAIVVYAQGAMVGVRYLDRRGLRARIGSSGKVAEVLRWDSTGATLALALPIGQSKFEVELSLGSISLSRRAAVVVRAAGLMLEVRFVELAP